MAAGAILCGGQSRRMGRTKALIEIDGRPMATRVATTLRSAGCPNVVLVGGDSGELMTLGLPVVDDRFPGEGPVGGLLTALRHFEGRDVMLVPCDIPFLDVASVERVRQSFERCAADVAVARTDRIEPLCAMWRSNAHVQIQRAFDGGARAMHQVLDALVVVEVQVDGDALRNINQPDDLPAR